MTEQKTKMTIFELMSDVLLDIDETLEDYGVDYEVTIERYNDNKKELGVSLTVNGHGISIHAIEEDDVEDSYIGAISWRGDMSDGEFTLETYQRILLEIPDHL